MVSVPRPQPVWTAHEESKAWNFILTELRTDDGLVGYGEIHGTPMPRVCEWVSRFGEIACGMDALATVAVWEKLFALASPRPGGIEGRDGLPPPIPRNERPQALAALAGIDIALWDIKGKAAGLPVYRLLGGETRPKFTYATGGYYRPGTSDADYGAELATFVELLRRSIGEYNFAGQYQQSPAPLGGGRVKAEWFKRYRENERPERFDRIVQSWDTANKATEQLPRLAAPLQAFDKAVQSPNIVGVLCATLYPATQAQIVAIHLFGFHLSVLPARHLRQQPIAKGDDRRRRFGREIDGHEDCIFVMVVSVPDRLVLIGIKPRTYFDHCCGKFSIAYPDRDAVHSPLRAFVEVTMDLRQMLGQELLTNIEGRLDLKTRVPCRGCGAKGASCCP